MTKETESREEFVVDGKDIVETVKKIIKEGNARKIIIEKEDGKELMSIPLTFATVGAIFVPVFAAIGAMAALLTKCKIVVIKEGKQTWNY